MGLFVFCVASLRSMGWYSRQPVSGSDGAYGAVDVCQADTRRCGHAFR